MPDVSMSVKGKDPEFAKQLKVFSENNVYVGIPDSGAGRSEGAVSNAELLFIHTFGSPVRGIPARPLIEPALEQDAVATQIGVILGEAAKAAIEDEGAGMEKLEEAGIYAENAVKDFFHGANNWPPNSENTIKQKGNNAPLIDTGSLRSAITHIIRKG